MNTKQAFFQHLTQKCKKQTHIDMSRELLDNYYNILGCESPCSETIDAFVRGRWSGYVSRDRATYQILNDYANFCECETEMPMFTIAFREHVRDTFEGEARKAVRTYKNALVYIPKGTKIDSAFLGELTNDEFVDSFLALQKLIYAIYGDICGSPFDWGWPDWNAITAEGLNQNRVIMILDALTSSGHMDSGTLVVEKKRFVRYNICKPIAKTTLMLKKFMEKGFHIEKFDDKKSPVFSVSYPDRLNLIYVLRAYFMNRRGDCKNHIHTFSYRFVEDPVVQTRETFFLAKMDGEPAPLRKIYYWLYDEAIKHGFTPKGCESMGCYEYKKGTEEWLLLGNGSSYHEDEFLHSVHYKLAVKIRLNRVFQTHPEKIDDLRKRFPESFGRPWTACFKCKNNADDCKNRVTFKKNEQDYHHCGTKHYFYFHNPNFDDVKAICELYKLENKTKLL